MEGKKKWLTVLRVDQYEWIKDMAKKTGVKGSDILVEALDRIMNDRDFTASLAEVRLKAQLQQLNDEAMRTEQKANELRKAYKELTGKTLVRV